MNAKQLASITVLMTGLTAGPISAQQSVVSCESYLAMDDPTQRILVSGMVLGFSTAAGLAERVRLQIKNDTTTQKTIGRTYQTGRREGALLVSRFIRDKLNEAPAKMNMRELALRMAALCNRPKNRAKPVGFVFLDALDEVGVD